MTTYDPAKFALERLETVSARLGELVLGESRLGSTVTAWVPIPAASVSLSTAYTPNADGVLIFDSETATVSLSWWDSPERGPLYPADRVRVTYDNRVLFLGTVDSTNVAYSTDPAGRKVGRRRRVDFTANLVGSYAAAMARQVCVQFLPGETAINRIRRWVTVDGWPS